MVLGVLGRDIVEVTMGVCSGGDVIDGGRGAPEGSTRKTRFLGFFILMREGEGGGCGNKDSGKFKVSARRSAK